MGKKGILEVISKGERIWIMTRKGNNQNWTVIIYIQFKLTWTFKRGHRTKFKNMKNRNYINEEKRKLIFFWDFCNHAPALKEVAIKDKRVKYFLHYSESRVFIYMDTNLWKQCELQTAIRSNMQRLQRGRPQAPGKKTSGLPIDKCSKLKPWLVDDWDLTTRKQQVFYLPAKKNMDPKSYAVNEVVAHIKKYFRELLGTQILYNLERPQDTEILADHPDVPDPAMLAYTTLDEKSLVSLLNYPRDFLKYLAQNSATQFSARDYEVALLVYHREAV
ncbi:unnamed protein product [Nyctereutes procyonoides]|uniref:(raccoon dog) hypothetical protein n=1 Tax=Nyctereutes procyonoides TaxID=34880 RepID=A0A811YK06_NYCPR|nr:unnamed protein product [Nyctereutes procyonoides]